MLTSLRQTHTDFFPLEMSCHPLIRKQDMNNRSPIHSGTSNYFSLSMSFILCWDPIGERYICSHFQVLPNVKHVPAHLMRGGLAQASTSSQNSSRSSTPAGVPAHWQQEGRRIPVSERPYSPANYGACTSPLDELHRDRSNSREREAETEADVIARFTNMQATVPPLTLSGE
jgi:hypothetical protein